LLSTNQKLELFNIIIIFVLIAFYFIFMCLGDFEVLTDICLKFEINLGEYFNIEKSFFNDQGSGSSNNFSCYNGTQFNNPQPNNLILVQNKNSGGGIPSNFIETARTLGDVVSDRSCYIVTQGLNELHTNARAVDGLVGMIWNDENRNQISATILEQFENTHRATANLRTLFNLPASSVPQPVVKDFYNIS